MPKTGKHVACTVPMATSKEQIKEIVELQRKVGKVYMMMETVVYAREYLFAKDLYDRAYSNSLAKSQPCSRH